MITLTPGQYDELWSDYWKGLTKEWFKLEVRQEYLAEDDSPSLRAWLNGDKQMSRGLLSEDDDPDFTAECRQKAQAGVDLTRIHIIEQPLSRYMEWELEYYMRVSGPLRGENVFVVDRSSAAGLALPPGDLMIFDNRRAIENIYDQNGRLAGAKFYDDQGDDLSQFLVLKNALAKLAMPLNPAKL